MKMSPAGGRFWLSTVSHVIMLIGFVSEAIQESRSRDEKGQLCLIALARNLKLNQTRTIGMLITASTNRTIRTCHAGVERGCFMCGYSLVLQYRRG